jgi:alanyl-tRNA synthetase
MNALSATNKMNEIEVINGVQVLYVYEQIESSKAKQMAFDFRDKMKSGIVILVSNDQNKCSYFVALSKDVVELGKKAGDIVKKINAIVDGRGGGKPDFAQGGCVFSKEIQGLKGMLVDIL